MLGTLKFLGVGITALCCVLCGFFKSYKLAVREKALEEVTQMLREMYIELSYNSPDTKELLIRIASKKDFKHLGFLNECTDRLSFEPFPTAWGNSLKSEKTSCFLSEDIQILGDLGKLLGTTDIEGQLAGIKALENRISLKLERARQNVLKEASLYRTLGILAGIGAVVITI